MSEFILEKLPRNIKSDYQKEAHKLIAKYDGMVELVDYPEITLDILFMQEASQSSELEGTIATISDILDFNVGAGADLDERKLLDIQEIENYKEALQYCIKESEDKKYNITTSLFKNMQHMLLNNSRGADKLKGDYKQSQNYIGNKYDGAITYTPVSPILTNDYMENLIEYINDIDFQNIDPLVKVAVIHAQFELIHPFEDGNGRVGRIIIPVLLKKYGIVETPFFYLSYYLSKNRDAYIGNLERISSHNDWESWVNFFVGAMAEQAKISMNVLRDLNAIRRDTKEELNKLRTSFSMQVLDFLFRKVKFTSNYFIEKTGINENTARILLKNLVSRDVISIVEAGSGTKSTIYKFDALYAVIQSFER